MNYALDQFTMTDGEVLIVQGAKSLYTYQNTGNSPALIQGSNDTVHWADIGQIAVGNSLIKEHSYKYLRLVGQTRVDVNRGKGDNTIVGGNSGGTADYPSFTGNANKVLAVKATEDGVEWKAVSSGGGSGGGINVIEYDPSQNEVVLSIQNSDFIPTPASAADTRDSASWNASTGVMGVSVSTQTIQTYPNIFTQQVGLRCPINLYNYRGSFTIDASQCEDAWGVGLLSRSQEIRNMAGIEGLDLYQYLDQQHFKNTVVGYFDLAQPQTVGAFINLNGDYHMLRWETDLFSGNYAQNGTSPLPTKPQGTYTFSIVNVVDAYSAFTGMPEEQVIALFESSFSESELALLLSKTLVFCAELSAFLELKADTPFLHFFMTAYHTPDDPAGTYELNPTSQLTITYNLERVENTVPAGAVDGDFLHLLDNANLLNKYLVSGDFVQLYDNKTKMIVHSNQP